MHSFAEFHVCSELEKESRRIILSRFEEVWRREEFLEISNKKLQFILSRKKLDIWKEEEMTEPIAKWIAYDVDSRIEYIYDLLRCLEIDSDEMYLKSALSLYKKYQSRAFSKVPRVAGRIPAEFFEQRIQGAEDSNRRSHIPPRAPTPPEGVKAEMKLYPRGSGREGGVVTAALAAGLAGEERSAFKDRSLNCRRGLPLEEACGGSNRSFDSGRRK
ncbi:kelch-like 23 [Crotalus adamanteus]|uniref:Kelch-like 23 n=1 Tax=Crotalus adamanteus TaxID=8729 RepID=A0AAW1C8G2_CROAD